MRTLSLRLRFAGFGIAICALSSASQSQGPQTASCPAGYSPTGALCLNRATGDVAEAGPAMAPQVAFDPGCAPGYWRLESLCLSSATGDVERVDETRWPADQRPGAYNR